MLVLAISWIARCYTSAFPFFLAFFNTAVIPFLLIVLSAVVETFKVIHESSSGM